MCATPPAIQGLTELQSICDVPADRRREMNLAINDEVKRLTRMISEYLDITRLESGATAMRTAPVRAEALLERTLLLLDPVAAQRRIQLLRRFAPDRPPFLAAPDLHCRAADDEKSIRLMLETGPALNGFRVTTGRNGREALEAATSGEFDAVLSDFYMPDGSGLELGDARGATRPNLPIILMTAQGSL